MSATGQLRRDFPKLLDFFLTLMPTISVKVHSRALSRNDALEEA